MAESSGYLTPQAWWFENKTPIESVFLMMQSRETMKWKSAGWTRYAKYSAAKTIGEAYKLGATRADLKYQVERGNMILGPPTAAARKRYDAERGKRREGSSGWLEARREYLAAEKPLNTLENSPEHHLAQGTFVETLGQVHKDAGMRGIKRATPAMPCFTLTNAAGDTIHSTAHEGHEQLVATWCLRPDDCVLEIGGGVGAVSTMIQKIIDAPAGHVVVEPQPRMVETLEKNKKAHGARFTVCRGAVSRRPMFSPKRAALDGPDTSTQRQWMFHRTSTTQTSGSARVPSLDPKDLRKHVAKDFTAVVVDCEGALPGIVDDFPGLFRGVRVVYLERDGPPGTSYAGVDAALEKEGLALVLSASKHRVYLKATKAELKRRDLAKARRLNNRVDAKTAQSYRSERKAPGAPRASRGAKKPAARKPAAAAEEGLFFDPRAAKKKPAAAKRPAAAAKKPAAKPSAKKGRKRSLTALDDDDEEDEVINFRPGTSRQLDLQQKKQRS